MVRAASALVLAGGRSSRFGSDKALAAFGAVTLIARAVASAQAAFAHVAVVAKEPARYQAEARGAALVADRSDLETPLAGLVAGAFWSPAELIFAFAADMPFALDAPLLEALFAAIEGNDAAVPRHGGELEPLCAVWRRGPLLAAGPGALAAGGGPRALAGRLRSAIVDWPHARPFLDADTPEALAALHGR